MSLPAQNNYDRDRIRRGNESFWGPLLTVDRLIAPMEDALTVAPWQRSRPLRFTLAVAGVLGVAALRWTLAPVMGASAAFLPFILIVFGAILFCGVGPAVVAGILSLLAGSYFAGMLDSMPGALLEAIAFVIAASGIIVLGELVNRLRCRLDQSDRVAAQRAREATELAEELNLLIDGAQGQAIYMLDPQGHVAIWNRGAERLSGWTEAEVIGKFNRLFYPPEAVAAGKPESDLLRARAEGQLEQEDWRLRKDGREFLASISTTALLDDAGALRGFAEFVSDITEKRGAEDDLRARESQLASILSTVPDAMVVIDENGLILSFSAAAQALFGYGEDEVSGRDVGLLMPPPDQSRHDDYIHRYLDTGEKRIIGAQRVVFGRRQDGSIFPMELYIGESVTRDHRIFTGFIRDLTERRRTDERLAELQAELIHVARVGALGSMASTLAHELNQPIGAITNYVEAVRDMLIEPASEDFPMIREALNEAAQDALRAGQIVSRLRDFVARGEIERTVEPLPALVNEAAVLGLLAAREKEIDVSFDLDPRASPVLVDRVQIQQVIINLMRNACEAMRGSPTRELTVASRKDDRGFMRVTISDTGPGIASEVADQLFTAFVSTKEDGMGLGLSICRTIVEANGGAIWMEPREGGGTIFHFTLPGVSEE